MSAADPRFAHLPAGHAPGPQSRRAVTSRRLLGCIVAFIGFVAVLMTVAFVLVAGAGPGDGGSGFPVPLLALLLPVIVLVGLVGLRRPRRARAEGLDVVLGRTQVRRGERVEVTVTVADAIGGPVEVELACLERYDVRETRTMAIGDDADGPARTTKEHVEWRTAQPLPGGAGTHRAALTVPPGAPYSHEGECLSFAWRVSVVERRTGDRRDRRTDAPLWVTP